MAFKRCLKRKIYVRNQSEKLRFMLTLILSVNSL